MKIIIFFTLMFMSTSFIYCQNAVASSGGEAIGSGGSSPFTIGQLVYTTNIESNGNFAQGVQQAFEFQSLNNANPTFKNYKIATYPNPTADFVEIEIYDEFQNNLNFTLFDIKGQLIDNGQIESSKTKIKMQHLANGVYFLKVLQQEQPLTTFQIIKI